MGLCLKLDETSMSSGLGNMPNSKSIESFIAEIQQELSVACALPFTVPKKEIIRIIELSAKWMYKNYEEAAEERYYLIPSYNFTIGDFKCDRTLILPKCILSVHGVNKVSLGQGVSNDTAFDGTNDTSVNKFFFKDIFFSSSGMSNSSENLMYYIISSYWMDMAQSVSTAPISYNYNMNSNKLVILGQDPNTHIILQVYRELPLEFLMNDEIFYRYCVAKCKQQLARILGTFNFNLPGGITINYDMLKEEGSEDLQKIEEDIKNEWGSDFFFITRNV
jgi:hypothetical protein